MQKKASRVAPQGTFFKTLRVHNFSLEPEKTIFFTYSIKKKKTFGSKNNFLKCHDRTNKNYKNMYEYMMIRLFEEKISDNKRKNSEGFFFLLTQEYT